MILELVLLALSQPNPEKLYEQGNAALAVGQYERAWTSFAEAMKAAPGNLEFVRAAGAALAAQGKLKAALPYFEKACEGQPRIVGACLQWGRSLYFLGRNEESLAVLDKIEWAGGSEAAWRLARAQTLLRLGRQAEVELELRRGMAVSALRPRESAVLQIFYANVLALRNAHHAAIWQFRQALRKTPDNWQLWSALGKSLAAVQEYPEAIATLEKALALSGPERNSLLLLSRIYAEQGELERSAEFRQRAEAAPEK